MSLSIAIITLSLDADSPARSGGSGQNRLLAQLHTIGRLMRDRRRGAFDLQCHFTVTHSWTPGLWFAKTQSDVIDHVVFTSVTGIVITN